MGNANALNGEGGEEEREGKLEGPAWWPLYGVLGIPGGLLFWEALNPLSQVPAQVVGFATLVLSFGGIALWLSFLAKE